MKKQIILTLMLASAGIGLQAQTYTTLGIGTADPVGTLHLHSSTMIEPEPGVEPPVPHWRDDIVPDMFDYNTILHITNTNTGMAADKGFSIDQYNHAVRIRQYEDADMTLENNNATLVLSSNGKVGIGSVSSGNHKFNVSGSAQVTGSFTGGGSATFAGSLTVGDGFRCTSAGALKVKSLRVTLTDWSDYVFDPAYRLRPLDEVEDYVQQHHHLPDIPSAAEVEEKGVDVGEMNKLLLQKVEELTLYVIDLQKQLDELKSNN